MGKCVLSLLIVEVEEFLGPSCGVCYGGLVDGDEDCAETTYWQC